MSKGHAPRPRQVSRAEYDLRWKYGTTDMTFKEFREKLKKIREAEKAGEKDV